MAIRVPTKLELEEVQDAFRQVEQELARVFQNDLDMVGRGIINSRPARRALDIPTLGQVKALWGTREFRALVESIVRQLLPPKDPEEDLFATSPLFDDWDWQGADNGLGWVEYGGGAHAWRTAEAEHCGIRGILTTNVANNLGGTRMGNSTTIQTLLPANLDFFEWIVRPIAPVTAVRYQVGLKTNPATSGAGSDGFFFAFDTSAGNTTWRSITRNGGVSTDSDCGVTVTAANWYRLRVDRTGAAEYRFSINERMRTVHTTNLTTAGVQPAMNVETLAAAVKGIDTDTFMLRRRLGQRYT